MRVIAGSARSLLLQTPKGLLTRPTTDKTKETLFNILQSSLSDCVFVDLYSGSGAIGIEALSRGARKAYFVETNNEACKCIQENIRHTHFEDRAILLKKDAQFALINLIEEPIDVLFMDPPYAEHAEQHILDNAKELRWITEDTIIVVEANLDADFEFLNNIGFEVYKRKKYKTSQHIFIRRRDN